MMQCGLLTSLSLLLCTCVVLVPTSDAYPDYIRRGPKRRCFQCNMPYECESGSCYGDVCIKSLAAPVSSSSGYVSKGCENITANAMLVFRYEDACKIETVFGVETMVCYCSDVDFCNESSLFSLYSPFVLFPAFFIRNINL